MSTAFLLVVDQGTTSTRAVVFDDAGRARGSAARELTQFYPHPGWVEHDPTEIWLSVADVVPRALAAAGLTAAQLAGIGLTNQRETVVLWDRADGASLTPAIVWQDHRTADFCRQHRAEAGWLAERTGLVLDPYFSATKIRWLLDADPSLRRRAELGTIAVGTVDSFLINRLTRGVVHATDRTNASRTLLLDLRRAAWDDDLCQFFGVPRGILPEVRPSAADFGVTRGLDFLPDGLPIAGVAGDQQAALFGQAGFQAGDAKCTYGTGAFFLLHLGDQPRGSKNGLLTTIAAAADDSPQYALEGSVFIAGAAVQWLRDGVKLIATAAEVEGLALESDPAQPVLFVPAFTGLGAPHWCPDARGAFFGLTRGTSAADLARAALEGVALQVVDLLDAAGRDVGEGAGAALQALRVDGGMARNAWFLQRQADLLGKPILQAPQTESTALGAAYLAGLHLGIWSDLDALRKLQEPARRFEPALPDADRQRRLRRWHAAIRAIVEYSRDDA